MYHRKLRHQNMYIVFGRLYWSKWRQQNKKVNNKKQGNRGDMRKIYGTLLFFEASGSHGDFLEKTLFI